MIIYAESYQVSFLGLRVSTIYYKSSVRGNYFKMKKLILIPYGGLANRIRFIETAYKCTQNRADVRIIVLWMKNEDIASFATDLFDVQDEIKVINIPAMHFIEKAFSYVLWKAMHLCRNYYIQKEFSFESFFNSNDPVFVCEGCDQFCEYDCLKLFVPKAKYVDAAKRITDTDNYVSMHIRRTDNHDSIEKSPIELFISKIEEEIEKGRKVYIASDDVTIKNELKQKYKSSILMQDIEKVSRNSYNGMEEAVIDMVCLARSEKIYGSFWSSFSIVASYVYGTPLEILRIDNK